MSIKLGVVMDSIETITPNKDSTLAMMLEAQQRDWQIYYMEQDDLFLRDGQAYGAMKRLTVNDDTTNWFEYQSSAETSKLSSLNVILMRKDPPFDMEYIYSTYILEKAEADGVLVVNKPQSLRDANEKLYTTWFPQCCPPSLISRKNAQHRAFLQEHKDIILKPLDGMGGASIFRLHQDDYNISVILETLTRHETRYIMAQRYIPEISQGDKRILVINGEPVPYALARIPAKGETRGNLAAGGRGESRPLSARDYWICEQVKATLIKKGLLFVGLDVIGDYLTEINVTSPTCIRELDKNHALNIAGLLMDAIEEQLN